MLANAPDPFSKPFLQQIKDAGEAAGTCMALVGDLLKERETAIIGMVSDLRKTWRFGS